MAKEKTREMPHSIEAEQAILGCMLIDVKIQVEAAAYLEEEDFYVESHKYIYSAMEKIIKENMPVDFVTLTDYLEKNVALEKAGGIDYIAELTNIMPSSANYQEYLDIVKRDSMLRKLIKGSVEIIQECEKSRDSDVSLALAEKTIYDISNLSDTSEIVKINTVLPEVMNKFDQLSKDKSTLHGIKTNYRGLDALTNGLQSGNLIIIAGRPGMGKTSFAMNLIYEVAKQDYSCAVFSLEMTKDELVQRMLCSTAMVASDNALKGRLNKDEWIKIVKAREELSKYKIFIDDSSIITPEQVLSKCRRLKKKHGLDLVMIDYIQLMTTSKKKDSENRQQEVADISRLLKILAKELNVPVLALSQLSRQVEMRGGRPQLSDLRESGSLEQDANIVMFIHRPDKDKTTQRLSAMAKPGKEMDAQKEIVPNHAEVIIEKNRSGSTGVVDLYFKGEYTRFFNYNAETKGPEYEIKNSTTKEVDMDMQTYSQESEVVKSIDSEIF